jgi:hypothetical protein
VGHRLNARAQAAFSDLRGCANGNLRGRYLETTQLASQYTRLLDALNAARRVDEIRIFHALDYTGKKERVLQLMGRRAE